METSDIREIVLKLQEQKKNRKRKNQTLLAQIVALRMIPKDELEEVLTHLLCEKATPETYKKYGIGFREIRFFVDRFCDPPSLLFFSTRISRDQSLETRFIRGWVKAAFKTVGVLGPRDRTFFADRNQSSGFFAGLIYLIAENLFHLESLCRYTSDENWAKAYPKRLQFTEDLDEIVRETPWGDELPNLVQEIRASHRRRVAEGDKAHALYLLDADLSWIVDSRFSGLLNADRGVSGQAADLRIPRKVKELRRFLKPIQIRSSQKDACQRHAFALFFLRRVDSLNQANEAIFQNSKKIGLGDISDETARRYIRTELKQLAERARNLKEHRLGKAFLETALYSLTPTHTG